MTPERSFPALFAEARSPQGAGPFSFAGLRAMTVQTDPLRVCLFTPGRTMLIDLARQDAIRNDANLPDEEMASFEEGDVERVVAAARTVIARPFDSHVEAVMAARTERVAWCTRSSRWSASRAEP